MDDFIAVLIGICIQISWVDKKETRKVFDYLVKNYKGSYQTYYSSSGFKNASPVIKYINTGIPCKILLENIKPYLKLKSKQADLAIKTQNTIKYGVYGYGRPCPKSIKLKQEQYYLKNKELNSKNKGIQDDSNRK